MSGGVGGSREMLAATGGSAFFSSAFLPFFLSSAFLSATFFASSAFFSSVFLPVSPLATSACSGRGGGGQMYWARAIQPRKISADSTKNRR